MARAKDGLADARQGAAGVGKACVEPIERGRVSGVLARPRHQSQRLHRGWHLPLGQPLACDA